MDFAIRIPEEMRRKYSERRARDAEQLLAHLEEGRFDGFAHVGHQLKGNAATFGYENLAELGRRMETAAARKSVSEARDCLYRLQAWVQEQRMGEGSGEDG